MFSFLFFFWTLHWVSGRVCFHPGQHLEVALALFCGSTWSFTPCWRDILLRVALLACCVTRLVILGVIRDGTFFFFGILKKSSRNHKKDRVVYQWMFSSESSKIKVLNRQLFCRSVLPSFNVVKWTKTFGPSSRIERKLRSNEES